VELIDFLLQALFKSSQQHKRSQLNCQDIWWDY